MEYDRALTLEKGARSSSTTQLLEPPNTDMTASSAEAGLPRVWQLHPAAGKWATGGGGGGGAVHAVDCNTLTVYPITLDPHATKGRGSAV